MFASVGTILFGAANGLARFFSPGGPQARTRGRLKRSILLFFQLHAFAMIIAVVGLILYLHGFRAAIWESRLRAAGWKDRPRWSVYDYASSDIQSFTMTSHYPPGTRQAWILQLMEDRTTSALHLTTGSPATNNVPMLPNTADWPEWAVISKDVSLERIQYHFQDPNTSTLVTTENAGTCFWHERALRFPFHAVNYAGLAVRRPTGQSGTLLMAVLGGEHRSEPVWGASVFEIRVHRGWFLLNVLVIAGVLWIVFAVIRQAWNRMRAVMTRIVRRIRSEDPGCVPCSHCGYDLRGSIARCPECGLTQVIEASD